MAARKNKRTSEEKTEFDTVVNPLLPELEGVAHKLTKNSTEAQDLLQESTLRAWRYWDSFESGTNRRAWMFAILRNTFINAYRRDRIEKQYREALTHTSGRTNEPSADSFDDAITDAMSDEVVRALDSLQAPYREVVVKVDILDQSYQEVAKALDCPLGTVMSRLHRGRKMLEQRLKEYASENGYTRAA